EKGWFIEPTLVQTDNPSYRLLCEEIFGPVMTVYVYDDAKWAETLQLVDQTSQYALTGAVFARDRRAILEAHTALRSAADAVTPRSRSKRASTSATKATAALVAPDATSDCTNRICVPSSYGARRAAMSANRSAT
ncbi:MAG: aldehyde dehydrogenase family protein, partial [Acidobacteriota bacterium]